MIAVSSKGVSFRALAAYLVRGRGGEEAERVAWTAARNLPTDAPLTASTFMRATAEANARAEKPVYHLVLSFDPRDAIDRATMERVADRVLQRLGLGDHQVVLVAHRDRAHPHVHVMVNRVHPETHRTWDVSHEYRAVQRILRAVEHEFGLTVTPGRLADTPERTALGPSPFDRPAPSGATRGELHQQRRSGEPPFVERVRGVAAELRAATSWHELQGRLAARGLRLDVGRDAHGRARGLVITDGVHHVRASRVGREFSKDALERRYGVAYEARDTILVSPVEQVARDVRRLAYAQGETARHFDLVVAATEARRAVGRAAGGMPERGAPEPGANARGRDRRATDEETRRRILAERAARADHEEVRSRTALHGLGNLNDLKRVVEWGMRHLLPPEVEALRRLLAPAEVVLLRSLRSRGPAYDVARGRGR